MEGSRKLNLNGRKSIMFLRTNFWYELKFGGSVSHTQGVADAFALLGHDIEFVSSDKLANIAYKTQVIEPNGFFSYSPILKKLVYNFTFFRTVQFCLKGNIGVIFYSV